MINNAIAIHPQLYQNKAMGIHMDMCAKLTEQSISLSFQLISHLLHLWTQRETSYQILPLLRFYHSDQTKSTNQFVRLTGREIPVEINT